MKKTHELCRFPWVDTSKESDALSKDLLRRGFKFVGATICYAHMQATGMVIDNAMDCFHKKEIIAMR
jgi:DNA-3-methyladenine glycosylase I